MFNFGKMGNMMKEAMALRNKLNKIQKRLKKITVEGISSDGNVRVVANGKTDILKIEISEELIQKQNKKQLEKQVLEAVQNAIKKSQEVAQKELKEFKDLLPPGF